MARKMSWSALAKMSITRLFRTALLGACLLSGIFAASADVQITGRFSGVDKDGYSYKAKFSCTGMPTCVGAGTSTEKPAVCSNSFTYSPALTITGIDLSQPSFQAHIAPAQALNITSNADGTCNYAFIPATPDNSGGDFMGTWDGTNGTITMVGSNGKGSFTASGLAPAPVFPMTVSSNITPTTVSATADIQPRPQDVGITASIFVFAQVPSSQLGKALAKRAAAGPRFPVARLDGDQCVLAQVDPSGHLAGVSASTMQPYFTGVLSAQSQSVTILNNAASSSVAGATFFVGYGSDAGSMLANGVYQAAIVVPGASQCTASLASAPAPEAPGKLTGLWWNAAESGWGIHFTRRGSHVFAAWYTYDAAGTPKWYVASDCAMAAGATETSGSCSGDLYEVHGPSFLANAAFDSSRVSVNPAGTLKVAFTDANSATMTYTLAGQTRTVPLTRQVFQSGTTPPAVDYTDLWWNPSESGWGMAVSHQYGVMFLAWFVYDGSGNPVWYVASNCTVSGSSCSGKLYRTTGPAFGPTFDPSRVQVFEVGTVTATFGDANSGSLSYTIDGVTSSKKIQRQLF